MAFVKELLVGLCTNQMRETFLDSKKHMHWLWFSPVVTLCSSYKECNSAINVLLRSAMSEYGGLSQ